MELLNFELAQSFDNTYLFQRAIEIFDKPWRTWENEEKIIAMAIMHKFNFFLQKSNPTHINDLIHACLKKVKLEFFKQGQAIWHIGDDSKKLYFLLKGNVIKFAMKNDPENEDQNYNIEEKYKLMKVVNMLGLAKTELDNKKILINKPEMKSLNKFKLKRPVISKLKYIKELIPNEINFDILPYIISLKLTEKYFKSEICTIRFEEIIMPGEVLGENDVFMDKPYSSFVFGLTDVYMFSIAKKEFNHLFDQLKTTYEKKHILLSVFPQFREEILRKFCMCLEERCYRINEFIYDQNDKADAVYFVKSGEVQLLKCPNMASNASNLQKNNQIETKKNKDFSLAIISQNQFFGEEILLGKKVRDHRAVAKSNVILFRLSSKIIRKYPLDLYQIIEWIKKNAILKTEWRQKRLKRFMSKDERSKEDAIQDIKNYLFAQKETTQKIIQKIHSVKTVFNFNLKKIMQHKSQPYLTIKQFGSECNKTIPKNLGNNYERENSSKLNRSNTLIRTTDRFPPSFLTHHAQPTIDAPMSINRYFFPFVDYLTKTQRNKIYDLKSSVDLGNEPISTSTKVPPNSHDSRLQETLKEKFDILCKTSMGESSYNSFQLSPKLMINVVDFSDEPFYEKSGINTTKSENTTSTQNLPHPSNYKSPKNHSKPKIPPISLTSLKKKVSEIRSQRNIPNKFIEINTHSDGDDILDTSIYYSTRNHSKSKESPRCIFTKTKNFSSFLDSTSNPKVTVNV